MTLLGRKKMKTVIQPTGWNPFESYIVGAALAAGVSGLVLRGKTSQAVMRELPNWVLHIWYIGLIVGAVLTLIGIHINFRFRLHAELTGVGILGGISAGYSSLIAVAGSSPFAYSVLITAAFSLACFVRTIQLIRILQKLAKVQEVMLP